MKRQDILIIGGGASGILAAIIASRNHFNVTILERNIKIGKKILATGNGRCNFTNTTATKDDYNHPEFVSKAFQVFSPFKTMNFFEELGIAPKVEDQGKTYPLSEQASSIVDVLLYEVNRLGIKIITEALVKDIKKNNNLFTVTLENGKTYNADQIIICTGGKAMPSSGSDGSGYMLAKMMGHHITPIFPALVKLKLDSPYLKQLDGVKFPGRVELIHRNQVLQEEQGDILFTKFGISGPTILQLSRKANAFLAVKEEVWVKVILVNLLSRKDVEKRLSLAQNRPIDFSLIGLIHKKIIPSILKEAGIHNPSMLVKDVSIKEKNKLIHLLFDWRFLVKESHGFEDAQVTAGGVDIREINEDTMESKLVKGLYFAGEVIDVDGLCGGYNLQWAWSSAYLAAISASSEKK
ncbi:MAG: NAD(P)/FAD-dependent oxidoreductase [Firmicutes bacterium]|nr:NAD(P)/FAD-dependent oxidoreductase [Bacillota bacterium]